MLEALLEIIGEFLLQAFGEALVELGLHALGEPFHRRPNPWLAALGYAGFGAWRARRGQPVLRIDRFAYGYLFALTFALIRFKFAN